MSDDASADVRDPVRASSLTPDSPQHAAPTKAVPTVRYIVRDVDAALAFYTALGFVLVDRWGPPFAIVARDGLSLWLSGPGSSATRPLPDGTEPAPGGWTRLVIEIDDLDATVERLRWQGVRFRSEPISGPGGRQVLVEDPSGNPVELFQPNR
jgi:catechol 2,3-dioxygenase-like lactoylglutathione lyase family enzyme